MNPCGSTTSRRGTGRPFWMSDEVTKYGSSLDEGLRCKDPGSRAPG